MRRSGVQCLYSYAGWTDCRKLAMARAPSGLGQSRHVAGRSPGAAQALLRLRRKTFVTRTSKAVGGFEPVQTLRSPTNGQHFGMHLRHGEGDRLT
jgi:hypothetical protein